MTNSTTNNDELELARIMPRINLIVCKDTVSLYANGERLFSTPTSEDSTFTGTPIHKDSVEAFKSVVEAKCIEARLDERENMKFIDNKGEETHAPFTQYRFTGDGLLLDWEDRTNDLTAQQERLKT